MSSSVFENRKCYCFLAGEFSCLCSLDALQVLEIFGQMQGNDSGNIQLKTFSSIWSVKLFLTFRKPFLNVHSEHMLAHQFVWTEPIVQKDAWAPFYCYNNHPYGFIFNYLVESMVFNFCC